jgi:hypothetical protein
VPLSPEPVPPAKLRRRGGTAELGLLDAAAPEADEVMMMAGLAADIRGTRVAGKRPHRSGAAEELHRAVDGGKPEPRLLAARLLEELNGGEAAVTVGDQVEDGTTLWSKSEPSGQYESAKLEPLLFLALRPWHPVDDNDSHFQIAALDRTSELEWRPATRSRIMRNLWPGASEP